MGLEMDDYYDELREKQELQRVYGSAVQRQKEPGEEPKVVTQEVTLQREFLHHGLTNGK